MLFRNLYASERIDLLVDVVERFIANFATDGKIDVVAIGQTAAQIVMRTTVVTVLVEMVVMLVVDVVVVMVQVNTDSASSSTARTAKIAIGTCCK